MSVAGEGRWLAPELPYVPHPRRFARDPRVKPEGRLSPARGEGKRDRSGGAGAGALRGSLRSHLRVTDNSQSFLLLATPARPSFANAILKEALASTISVRLGRLVATGFHHDHARHRGFRFRSTHPTNNKQHKKEAERRKTLSIILRTLRCGAAPTGAARLPAFHHGSCQRDSRIPSAQLGPGFPGTQRRYAAGYPRRRTARLQRCTSHAGHSAGRHDARAARERR